MTNIFVGNLSFRTTESELRDAFSQYGNVSKVSIVMDRETGRSRGFGFVEMDDSNEARAAIEGLNQSSLGDRTISCNEARERESRSSGGGGGGYNGGRGNGYGDRRDHSPRGPRYEFPSGPSPRLSTSKTTSQYPLWMLACSITSPVGSQTLRQRCLHQNRFSRLRMSEANPMSVQTVPRISRKSRIINDPTTRSIHWITK